MNADLKGVDETVLALLKTNEKRFTLALPGGQPQHTPSLLQTWRIAELRTISQRTQNTIRHSGKQFEDTKLRHKKLVKPEKAK